MRFCVLFSNRAELWGFGALCVLDAKITRVLACDRITGLVIWYGFDDHDSGEQWTVWSYLELLGFILLVYGTVAYRELLPIPCCTPVHD